MPHDRESAPRIERRFTAHGLKIERHSRAEGEPARAQIVGHAAVFDQWTTLIECRYWTWREVIKPGAFANSIREKQDVRALFNHDSNFVLGRTKAGTLALEEDEVGLLSRTDPPDTQTIRDLVLAPIERGDVSGMSFAFLERRAEETVHTEGKDFDVIDMGGLVITLRYQDGGGTIEEWEVKDADLFDVSPVTFPAYEGTDVALRSRPDMRALIEEKNRPHNRKVAAPLRDSFQAWLDAQKP